MLLEPSSTLPFKSYVYLRLKLSVPGSCWRRNSDLNWNTASRLLLLVFKTSPLPIRVIAPYMAVSSAFEAHSFYRTHRLAGGTQTSWVYWPYGAGWEFRDPDLMLTRHPLCLWANPAYKIVAHAGPRLSCVNPLRNRTGTFSVAKFRRSNAYAWFNNTLRGPDGEIWTPGYMLPKHAVYRWLTSGYNWRFLRAYSPTNSLVGQTGVDPVMSEDEGFTDPCVCRFATDPYGRSPRNRT